MASAHEFCRGPQRITPFEPGQNRKVAALRTAFYALSKLRFFLEILMRTRAIFIAATGQNMGKTTTCLGVLAGLRRRYASVGFIKPVGQVHVTVDEGLAVDKDAVLFKETFGLQTDYRDLSPVIIPAGFSRAFLDREVPATDIRAKISDAFLKIASQHQYTVVEGTGHIGVGSIIGLDNASVARDLGVEMVIVVSGGLGSAIDSLALNLAMCERRGVKVRGVILNRVLDDKREMILNYFPRALQAFGVPLLGCIPYCDFLSIPTMRDFEALFESPLLAGHEFRFRHFRHTRLVAGSLSSYLSESNPSELVITPASREDIIQTILERQHDHKVGLLLTGRQPPSDDVLQSIQASNVPTIYVPLCSYDAMKAITSFTAKIRGQDVRKVQKAIALVEQHIDFDTLCHCEAVVPT
jgi:phosphate acetyltransferase